MKLQLNKLMAGLVMAGGAVALVGCGDGGSPTLGASSNATTVIKADDKAAIQSAQTITRAFGEAGANFPLGGGVVFNTNVTNPTASVPPVPPNSTLNLNPSTNARAIGDFKISAPGTTKTVQGFVLPGSCQFTVTGPSAADLLDGYVLGNTYAITPCNLSLQTSGVNVGVEVAAGASLTLGYVTIPANDPATGAPRTVTVTVSDTGAVTAVVPAGTQIPLVDATTGAPLLNADGTPQIRTTTAAETITVAPAGTVRLTTGT